MQLLIIKINALHANPEYALLGKKEPEAHYIPSEWDDLRSLTKGRRVVVLLPNSDVVLTQVNIPSKNKKQLAQAIPFALEDTLAEDIENLHFATHQQEALGDSNVAIINRERLDLVITLLRKNGITAHYILPQLLSQAYSENTWSIIQQPIDLNGNRPITIRLTEFNGFSCDKNLLNIFLTEQLEKTEPEALVTNIDVSELPKSLQSLSLTTVDPTLVQYNSIEKALPLNLLTGFVSQKSVSSFDWKAWRPPIILASLIGIIWLGIMGWQNSELQQQNKQLSQSINSLFKATFPESRLIDAPQQMSNELTKLKKGTSGTVGSPLPLIADISPLLKLYKDLTLKEIRYQENELVLVMQAPSLTHLENFKKDAAKKSNLKVSIKSSTTTADKVESQLIITPIAQSEVSKVGANS